MLYEAILSDRARWAMQRLNAVDHAQVVTCIGLLEHNPFPDSSQRVTLVSPLDRVFRGAFHCGEWGIAFRVEAVFVVIEDVGRLLLES